MNVIHLSLTSPIEQENLALCLGFFDGMHKAHQLLLNTTIETAKNKGIPSGMMTFSTYILSVLKNQPFQYLTSLEDKIKIAEELGFDYFYVLDVTSELISLPPQGFIDLFLKKQSDIIVGFDFTYGAYGKGNVELLKKQSSFQVISIDEQTYDHQKIGSSLIREYVKTGQMDLASQMLGRPYQMHGEVIHGKKRGTLLGFPTANIDFKSYLLPKVGVYFGKVFVKGTWYHGLINVGDNPTFQNIEDTIEVYILDFDQDIYGEFIDLSFIHFMRDELTFTNINDLIIQMKEDVVKAKEWILKEKNDD